MTKTFAMVTSPFSWPTLPFSELPRAGGESRGGGPLPRGVT